MAIAGGGAALCVSGAALSAALSTLFLGREDRRQELATKDVLELLVRSQRPLRPSPPYHGNFPVDDSEVPCPSDGWVASRAAARSRAEVRRVEPENAASVEASGMVNMAGGWQGFSMEDSRKRNMQMQDNFKELSPAEVLVKLQRGNARFWTGCASRPEASAFERRAMIMQQFPSSAILGCSDSRVPVEVVFDQGLGDMFVVRVAGNSLDTTTTASLQYAVHHLSVKVLVVMGHEGCGAIKAAGLPIAQIEQEPQELANALKMLKRGLDEQRLKNVHDARAYDREAVITNVRRQVEGLCRDAAIMKKVQNEELIVVGCFYEISSGIVDFFMEVTEAPTAAAEPHLVMRGVHSGVQSRMEYHVDQTPKADCEGSEQGVIKRSKSSFMPPSPDSAPVRPSEGDEIYSPTGISSQLHKKVFDEKLTVLISGEK
ncbi:unnamed protein product [Polarella glacialis]|uniref:carbonic anhydrase n=1 Tax=Polarella glacialis TaxID=89957 RepID=A0A813M0P5_POLGL|nr:unnamed protein product [Polarella glacialis]